MVLLIGTATVILVVSTISLVNSERITVSRGGLVTRHGPVPWFGNVRLRVAAIEQLFCEKVLSADTRRHGFDLSAGLFIEGGESGVTYNLNANKLTKQQVMNFFKLWMIAVGPTNDE